MTTVNLAVVDDSGTVTDTRKLTGIANGEVSKTSTDAVSGKQLWSVKNDMDDMKLDIDSNTRDIAHLNNTVQYYGKRLDYVEKTVHQNRKIASAGIAGAMAMASMPYVETSKYSFGLGSAVYDGQGAISAGFTFQVGEKSLIRINTSYDTQSKAGVGIGFAIGWD